MDLKSVGVAALSVASLGVMGVASAQGVDTSAAAAAFGGVETAVNVIGPLMLGAVAAGIIYKWVTAFLI